MASIKVFGQLELGSNDKGLIQSKDVYHGNLPLNQVITDLQNSGGSSGSFEIPELDLQGITMPGNIETANYLTAFETSLDDYGADLSNVDTIRQSPIIYIKNTAESADTIYYVAYKVCEDEENSTYIIYTGDGINDGREPIKCGILYLSSTDTCTIKLYIEELSNVAKVVEIDYIGIVGSMNMDDGEWNITKELYDQFDDNVVGINLKMEDKNDSNSMIYNYYAGKGIHLSQGNLHSYQFYSPLIENTYFIISTDGTNYKFGIQKDS